MKRKKKFWTDGHYHIPLTGMSLSIARGGPMLYMQRLRVSLGSEAAMFWWTPSVPISSGLPWSWLCLAQVRIHLCLLLLGRLVVWSGSLSGRQICCRRIFDGKQSRDPVDLPSTCHLSTSLPTVAFRSREVKQLLPDLDSYGGTDPLGMFNMFLERTAEVLAPHLAVVFWWLLHLGSFPVCWRVANVTPITKGPPSSSASNYRPISLTPILSKVFDHLVSVRLRHFMECRGVLPTTQFPYRKGLGTCDALLCVAHLTEWFGDGAGS